MNPNPKHSNHTWQLCEKGVIGAVSSAINAREAAESRRRFLKSAVGAAAVLAGASWAGWSITQPKAARIKYGPGRTFAGISCSRVIAALPDYVRQTLDDQALVDAIAKHIEKCESCKIAYERELSQTA